MGARHTLEAAPYSITKDYNSVLAHIQTNLSQWYKNSRYIALPVIIATHGATPNFVGLKIQNSRYYAKIKRVLIKDNQTIFYLKITKRVFPKSDYRYGGLIDYIETP